MYTLEDLQAARADLERWQGRWENYSGNNPDKYRADIKLARAKVELIEADLKVRGLLPQKPSQ